MRTTLARPRLPQTGPTCELRQLRRSLGELSKRWGGARELVHQRPVLIELWAK